MVLMGLKRGKIFSIDTSSDSKLILNKKIVNSRSDLIFRKLNRITGDGLKI
jgi:hypothetical protein